MLYFDSFFVYREDFRKSEEPKQGDYYPLLDFYPLNVEFPIDIMRNSVFVSYVGVKTFYEQRRKVKKAVENP